MSKDEARNSFRNANLTENKNLLSHIKDGQRNYNVR